MTVAFNVDVFYTGCMNMPVPLTPAGVSPARRGHKKETTCGFLLLVNLPLSLGGSGANRRPATAAKLGYGSRVTVAWLSPPFRSSQTAYCYTGRKVYAGATQGELPEGQEKVPWGIAVSRNSFV